MTPFDPSPLIAEELRLPAANVRTVLDLVAGGASVPFIARYRKEQSGGLDEVAVRLIKEKGEYLHDLHQRKAKVLSEIESQGKLTPDLKKKIEACFSKSVLEDLYLPFKPKRRTRAMMARERGLEPLAKRIEEQPRSGDPRKEAEPFVDVAKGVPDADAALQGARDIVAEAIAEEPRVRSYVRDTFLREGVLVSRPARGKTNEPTKFETYYDFRGDLRTLPSHRFLAIQRGEAEGVLKSDIEIDTDKLALHVVGLAKRVPASPFAGELTLAAAEAIDRLLCPSIGNEVREEQKLVADREAIAIFAENLKKLLLQPALGRKVVLGIDPGQRTGCKCVVVDDTGKLLTHTLVNLVTGDRALTQAKETLRELIVRHKPFAIAVGNGTHGRETADFCRDVVKESKESVLVVMVSESGASIYSASDVAREEFPDLDLTVRGAVSIARRLQDPLAELVKVDPKTIGVGQYQHDVHQPLLRQKLDEVVESCVNGVGVELNTASAPLLTHVAGVGESLAKKIVNHRNEHGAFKSRKDLLKVSGLGPKAFEQCAGFVRIREGKDPLDASAVHPERYALVGKIAKDAGVDVASVIGHAEILAKIPWSKYVSGEVGLPTLEDIRKELEKPGRDPREVFEAPAFRDDVRKIEDLVSGMELEGVVTNVTAFGAFVDVGVHQDGLVHVSQLADRFVKDPHEVAKVGDKLKVKVLEVDLVRKRIALTARSGAVQPSAARPTRREDRKPPPREKPQSPAPSFANNPFAKLLKR
jgi:protein Tex